MVGGGGFAMESPDGPSIVFFGSKAIPDAAVDNRAIDSACHFRDGVMNTVR